MPLLAAVLIALLAVAPAAAGDISVRITSPLGRTGTPGTIRIVAQVKPQKGQAIAEVRFSVDGKPQGSVTAGPPYVGRMDRRQPVRAPGHRRRGAGDRRGGRPRRGRPRALRTERDHRGDQRPGGRGHLRQDRPAGQGADRRRTSSSRRTASPRRPTWWRRKRSRPRLPCSWTAARACGANIDFVQEAAGRLAAYLRPKDRVIVAPFSLRLKAMTGPTNDRRTIAEAVQAITAEGGTASATRCIDSPSGSRPPPAGASSSSSPTATTRTAAPVRRRGDGGHEGAGRSRSTASGIGGVAGISLKGHEELKSLALATDGQHVLPAAAGRTAERLRRPRLRRPAPLSRSPTRRPTSGATARGARSA